MIVLWKILAVSELLKILGLKAREESRYIHSVVFLAQDFGVVEEMYKFVYNGRIYSDELERDLWVLRYVNVDFGRGRVNRARAEIMKDFIKDKETTTKIAEKVYSIAAGYFTERKEDKSIKAILHKYLAKKVENGLEVVV